jgi:hypothetical protein
MAGSSGDDSAMPWGSRRERFAGLVDRIEQQHTAHLLQLNGIWVLRECVA